MSRIQALRDRYRASADPLRTQRRIELVALVLALLVALQLAYYIIRLATMAAPEAVEPAADSVQVPVVYGPALVSASERKEIISRPLFWESRRPVDAAAMLADPGAGDGKPGELKDVKLVGVFGSGERAGIIALVRNQKRRILLGETLEGWTLKSIQPTEIVIASGAQTKTLALQRGNLTTSAASTGNAVSPRGRVSSQQPVAAPRDTQPGPQPPSPVSGVGEGKANNTEGKPEAEATLSLGPRG